MHADRTNRTAALLLAIVLIAAGGLGAAVSYGLFGSKPEHQKLTANPVSRYFGRHGDWLWPVVALLGVLLILVALRWLRALLFSTDRSGDLIIASEKGTGRTTLSSTALTAAVADEIGSYRGVASARSRLIGDPDEPTLVVGATVEDSADLVALRRQIETGALAHARQALDNPDLPIQLDLNVTTRRSSRVG